MLENTKNIAAKIGESKKALLTIIADVIIFLGLAVSWKSGVISADVVQAFFLAIGGVNALAIGGQSAVDSIKKSVSNKNEKI